MKHMIAAMSLALIAGSAFSQASAPAEKPNGAQSRPDASAPAPQPGMGPGGPGPGRGMMRFDEKNTPGWSLMTEQEHLAHRDKMHSFNSVDECKAYHDAHMKQMDARAKESGKAVRPFQGDPCAMMRQRGFLK